MHELVCVWALAQPKTWLPLLYSHSHFYAKRACLCNGKQVRVGTDRLVGTLPSLPLFCRATGLVGHAALYAFTQVKSSSWMATLLVFSAMRTPAG